MKQRARIYYSTEQKTLMRDRWQAGDSTYQIARLFDRGHSSIQGILAKTGGIRPPPRQRSRFALTLSEREEISRGIVAGQSLRSIAASLGRAASTVSREIKRNDGRRHYRASKADQAAWGRAHRPKTCKLVENRALARIVAKKLRELWSPEQIAGWLKYAYPDDENYCRKPRPGLIEQAAREYGFDRGDTWMVGDSERDVIAALAAVDAVFLFDDSTPLKVIETLKPDVLVKGGDYARDEVVGAREVESWGGRVVLVPLVAGRSTSKLIEKIAG